MPIGLNARKFTFMMDEVEAKGTVRGILEDGFDITLSENYGHLSSGNLPGGFRGAIRCETYHRDIILDPDHPSDPTKPIINSQRPWTHGEEKPRAEHFRVRGKQADNGLLQIGDLVRV